MIPVITQQAPNKDELIPLGVVVAASNSYSAFQEQMKQLLTIFNSEAPPGTHIFYNFQWEEVKEKIDGDKVTYLRGTADAYCYVNNQP